MSGVERIAAERQRQIAAEGWTAEGWTPEHDDQHDHSELAWAAMAYIGEALAQSFHDRLETFRRNYPDPPQQWPWQREWKPGDDPIRNLEKAGALIAAEIDRLERADSQSEEPT